MFERKNYEISFENLRINNFDNSNKSDLGIDPNRKAFANITNENRSSTKNDTEDRSDACNSTFVKIIKTYSENFIIISQKEKAVYLNITLSDLVGFFSIPLCTKSDGCTRCKYNCDCSRSLDVGMQIYERGGVHNFHQFGNFIIGYVVEQQTDPLTRIAIEFEKSMKVIKRIYCPCNLIYCPHAFAVLYFRLKIQSFYAIKLPQELFNESIEQVELIKFYGYLIEESRSLPIMCDYQTKEWSPKQLKQYTEINGSMMYAYCHKSLLPIPVNIIEEQARARKWISDLHTKRSFSCTTFASMANPLVNSVSDYSFGKSNNNSSGNLNKANKQNGFGKNHSTNGYNNYKNQSNKNKKL